MQRIRVGVFFGGRSTEHEVTIWSAKSIVENLDPEKYDIVPDAVAQAMKKA